MWNSGIRTLTPSEHMSLLGLSISAVYCTMSYMWPALPWYTLVGSCFFGHYVAWNHGLDALRYGASLKKSHLPTPRSCLRWREKKVQSPRFPSQYGNAFSNWQLMFPYGSKMPWGHCYAFTKSCPKLSRLALSLDRLVIDDPIPGLSPLSHFLEWHV